MNTGWEGFETFSVATSDRGAASGTLWPIHEVERSWHSPRYRFGRIHEAHRRVKLAIQVLRGDDEWSNS